LFLFLTYRFAAAQIIQQISQQFQGCGSGKETKKKKKQNKIIQTISMKDEDGRY